jgi:hypothetical protein
MPQANRQGAFGKFRRMILDWIPTSIKEKNMSHFLPKSSLKSLWWKQASIARDNGRKHLRIHGTGRVNDDKESSYYPHVPTSGCISTREGKYSNINYKDQRNILDTMMQAMSLAPVYSNEVELKGVLYVMNLDDQKAAVSSEEIETLLE